MAMASVAVHMRFRRIPRECDSPGAHYAALTLPPGSQSIRVLDLCCPEPSNQEEPLTGTMRVVDLKDSPAFTALSYVWGDTSPLPYTIRCNGFDLPVTDNCRDALLSLRGQYGALIIWVDAICINQDDEVEKAQQIGLMEEIYTWSRKVYIWLGPGDERSERAIDCLVRASRARLQSVATPWTDGRASRSARGDSLRSVVRMTLFFLHLWFRRSRWIRFVVRRWRRFREMPEEGFELVDIEYFLDRPWLRRVWTFQEIVLASNPIVVCGKRSIGWRHLQQGLDYLASGKICLSSDPDKQASILNPPVNSDVIVRWGNILLVWRAIRRPLAWNGRSLRYLSTPTAASNFAGYSVLDYERQQVDIESLAVWARCLAALFVLGFQASIILPIIGQLEQLNFRTSTIFLLAAFGFSCFVFNIGFFPYLLKNYPVAWWHSRAPPASDVVLVGILDTLRQRKASEAKDKVFAIHGVLRRLGISLHGPDYGKPLGNVYHDLFWALLRWRPSLITLLADVGSPMDGAPSCVPDWSTLELRQVFLPESVYAPLSSRVPNPHHLINWNSDREMLTVRAVVLGTASHCSGPLGNNGLGNAEDTAEAFESLAPAVRVLARWIATVRRDVPVGPPYESVPLTVFNCLRGTEKEAEASETAKFNNWYRILSSYQQEATATPDQDHILARLWQDMDAWEFTRSLCDRLSGRRGLFLSRDGHIGSGPPGMREGDSIVIIAGVSVPLIHREHSPGKYTVVGPAFVCGFDYDVSNLNADEEGREWQGLILV